MTNDNPYEPPMEPETNAKEQSRECVSLAQLVDAKTLKLMRVVVKDARSILLVFVVPCCVPIFGLISTIWLAMRLGQWYHINARYRDAIDRVIRQP